MGVEYYFQFFLRLGGVCKSYDFNIKNKPILIEIDGDYWHGNQWKLRGFESLEAQLEHVANRQYWGKKIRRNMERDRRINRELRTAGWRVVRVWESDVRKRPGWAASKVARAVRERLKGRS